MNSAIDPNDLYNSLYDSAGTRKRKSLEVIHQVCREQHEAGNTDFSVTTITNLAEGRGGPTRGSVLNKTGADFKALIQAWANHTGGSLRKPAKPVSPDIHQFLIDQIPDVGIRSVMNAVLAENRKLKRTNALMKEKPITINMQPQLPENASVAVLPASSQLTPLESNALRKALDAKFLAGEGWRLDPVRGIVSEKGRQIYNPDYVSAIRRILGDDAKDVKEHLVLRHNSDS